MDDILTLSIKLVFGGLLFCSESKPIFMLGALRFGMESD
jgi:hypothetical protein